MKLQPLYEVVDPKADLRTVHDFDEWINRLTGDCLPTRPLDTEQDLIAASVWPGQVENRYFFDLLPDLKFYDERMGICRCGLCAMTPEAEPDHWALMQDMWSKNLELWGVDWCPDLRL